MSAIAMPISIEAEAGEQAQNQFQLEQEKLKIDAPTVTPMFIKIGSSHDAILSWQLGTLFDGRFKVIKPIPVKFENNEGQVAALWEEIDEFGTGSSQGGACLELARSVAELYTTLKPEANSLGPDLQRVWSVLREHLQYSQTR
jgi:hypothetical protein